MAISMVWLYDKDDQESSFFFPFAVTDGLCNTGRLNDLEREKSLWDPPRFAEQGWLRLIWQPPDQFLLWHPYSFW